MVTPSMIQTYLYTQEEYRASYVLIGRALGFINESGVNGHGGPRRWKARTLRRKLRQHVKDYGNGPTPQK